MKYQNVITKKFAEFKYKPRKGQVELINKILEKYIDDKIKYVVLSASTGNGKSLIGLIVSECLRELKKEQKKMTSYVIAHTNTLLKQYDLSYNNNFNILRVMGRNNYDCSVMLGTAENCIARNSNAKALKTFCGNCEYANIHRIFKKSRHVITNYAYLFTAACKKEDGLENRILTIFDEAHLLNDQFVSHMQIVLTGETFAKMYDTLLKIDFPDESVTKVIFACIDLIREKKVNERNYMQFLEELRERLHKITQFISIELDYVLNENNKKKYISLNKKLSFFSDYKERIDEFLKSKFQHVVDIKPNSFEVLPIFINDFFNKVEFTDYYLFMSATIDEEYLNRTMNIPKNKLAFIKGGNIFDKENKTVVLCGHDYMNYTNMNDDNFIRGVNERIFNIINEHTDEKGIILTTNFKLTKQISDFLQKRFKENNIKMKVVEHNSKTPLKELLEEFKKYTTPAVLLSPSIFEGVDLPDDESRFQIFVKAPFYSLGNKRIQFIAQNYPDIYTKLAVFRVIQGSGRSVRSEHDFCVNYYLDSHLSKLFFCEHNLWKEEFEIIQ